MKLYTEEQVRDMLENMGTHTEEGIEYFISEMDSVELPTWDDVRKAIELAQTVKDYGDYKPYTEEQIIEQLKQNKVASNQTK